MKHKKQKNVGLIIKDSSLSAIEVEIRNGDPIVSNYATIMLEEGVVENNCIILHKEAFQEAVKKLLANGANGPIKTDDLLIALPEEKVFNHQIEIPKERIKDAEFIKEAAKDFIPIELNQAVFDYKIDHENPDGKTLTLNCVATQDSIVEPIIKALKEIDLCVTEINVDINCLIKSFNNSLNKAEGAFLLVNMKLERDLLAINSANDSVTKMISKGERSDMIDKLKSLLNLPSSEDVKQLLIKMRQEPNLTEDQKTNIKTAFKPYLDNLSHKIGQLIAAVQNQEPLEIKTIYLTGILSAIPGVEEVISNLLPNIPIKKTVQFTEIPPEIEGDILEGIGLCLNGTLPNDKNNFNLLPQTKKDEINIAKISPKLKTASIILAFTLMALVIKTGITVAGNYLDYRISSQEVIILNEQALNPYVTSIAKAKQATKQSKEQILSLIDDSVPVSFIIRDLDSYNNNGTTMVNMSYIDTASEETSSVVIRAKTVNRNETEKAVAKLENNPMYLEIESPLSNLVGKGERFISINLTIDKAVINEAFESQTSGETQAPDSPSIPDDIPLDDQDRTGKATDDDTDLGGLDDQDRTGKATDDDTDLGGLDDQNQSGEATKDNTDNEVPKEAEPEAETITNEEENNA